MKNGWFRFYSETISDRKLQRIARMTQQPLACIIGVWATVLSSANDSRANGDLMMTSTEPMTADDLADTLGMDGALIAGIVQAFASMDMIQNIDGRYHVTNWEKRQYVDTTNERVRRWRQKQSETAEDEECNVTETLQPVTCNAPVTHQTTDYRLQTTEKEGAAGAAAPAGLSPEESVKKETHHPALVVFREERSMWPAQEDWKQIIDAVGNTPDKLALWREILIAWRQRGYSKMRIDGPLEWLAQGAVPKQASKPAAMKTEKVRQQQDYWDSKARAKGLPV